MHFEFSMNNLNDFQLASEKKSIWLSKNFQIAMVLSKKVPMHFELEMNNQNDYKITSKKICQSQKFEWLSYHKWKFFKLPWFCPKKVPMHFEFAMNSPDPSPSHTYLHKGSGLVIIRGAKLIRFIFPYVIKLLETTHTSWCLHKILE